MMGHVTPSYAASSCPSPLPLLNDFKEEVGEETFILEPLGGGTLQIANLPVMGRKSLSR